MEPSALYRYNLRHVPLTRQHFINDQLRILIPTYSEWQRDEYGPFIKLVPFGTLRLRRALRNFARRLRARLGLISRPLKYHESLSTEDPM